MKKEDIIALPNPHLRQKSQRVGVVTPEITKIIEQMRAATIDWDLSRQHEVGVALAAVQIDKLYKIVIVRNDYDNKQDDSFTTFINPEITKSEGEIVDDFASQAGFRMLIFQFAIFEFAAEDGFQSGHCSLAK